MCSRYFPAVIKSLAPIRNSQVVIPEVSPPHPHPNPADSDTMLVDQVVLMLCTLWPVIALPLAPGNIGNAFAMQEGDGRILQRSKRGWMWNQFFLMEEYTGNDHQYVGKVTRPNRLAAT